MRRGQNVHDLLNHSRIEQEPQQKLGQIKNAPWGGDNFLISKALARALLDFLVDAAGIGPATSPM